jgi:predicted MPP superfamily phosphohydrolase
MTHHMTFAMVIVFILIAITVLFGAHFILYSSIVSLFALDQGYRIFLISALSFLGASFFISTFLVRWKEVLATRFFYFISGFWLGFLINLLLAVFVLWVFIWTGEMLGLSVDKQVFGVIFFGLAFLYSIYGSWSAFNPRLKNISVNIPGLPEEWKGGKIVQLSDVHLGYVHKADFMEKIVRKVNSVNPKLVLVTGDLLDGMDENLEEPLGPVESIKSEKGIYFITGNHETYLGLSEVFSAISKTKIVILNDQIVDVEGLKLIGISYPSRGEEKNIASILRSMKKDFWGKPNILMYHSPVNIEQIKDSGINLELCGHTHEGQLFPLNFITRIIYRGYDHGLYVMGDYTLYTTNGVGTWGPAVRTGNAPEITVITLDGN